MPKKWGPFRSQVDEILVSTSESGIWGVFQVTRINEKCLNFTHYECFSKVMRYIALYSDLSGTAKTILSLTDQSGISV